ncbi:hypothetical protein ACFE04_021019 [Oxalis oulophora]
MVKPKQKHLPVTSTNKKGARRNRMDEMDLTGEDGWVIVKKQKVVILIPPIPDTRKTTSPNPRLSQQQTTPRIALINQSHVLSEVLPEATTRVSQQQTTPRIVVTNQSHVPTMTTAGELEKSTSIFPKKDIQLAKIVRLSKIHAPAVRMGIKSLSQLDRSNLLNQRLRAENLERKLQRAGGLSRWLKSLGLEQFVTILQEKCVNKFQLVNLTMNKLKDMGAYAVGPRRKLMHAINCVCQPTVKIGPDIKTTFAYYK